MEKLVKVPFNAETAKKIQNGEIEGKIVTRDGCDAHVIYWEKKGICPIVALISVSGNEVALSFLPNGRYISENTDHQFDLLIQAPEWTTFKACDLIDVGGELYLISSTPNRCDMANDKGMDDKDLHAKIVANTKEGRLYLNYEESEVYSSAEFTKATKEQREKFIRLLNEDGSDKANKILEKYFGIKDNPKYKDGDVLYVKVKSNFFEEYVFIYKEGAEKTHRYCSICLSSGGILRTKDNIVCADGRIEFIRYATESEKGALLEALKESDEKEAKEYLKMFFNIEQEHKFKPFDKVLVRDYDDQRWNISFFGFSLNSNELRYYCMGFTWKQCIPYEGNEHLLGTTDNPE